MRIKFIDSIRFIMTKRKKEIAIIPCQSVKVRFEKLFAQKGEITTAIINN